MKLTLSTGVRSKLRVGGGRKGAIVYSKCVCEKFKVMPPTTPLKSAYTVHLHEVHKYYVQTSHTHENASSASTNQVFFMKTARQYNN